MKGVCPTCGTTASLEMFLVIENDRKCMKAVVDMPATVQLPALFYLSLFRPSTRMVVTPAKALRLLQELQKLIARGYVSAKDRPDRTCHPQIWAKAMEQMMVQRDTLRLPLSGHGYLKSVAWGLADAADQKQESSRITAERSHSPLPDQHRQEDDFDAEAWNKKYPQFAPKVGGNYADKS